MTRIFLSFLIVATTFLMASCLKPPEANKNFGDEIPSSKVQAVLQQAEFESRSANVGQIMQGEFVYTEKSTRIESLYPTIIKQRAETVVLKTETPNKIVFTIDREIRELENNTGSMKPSKSEFEACLEKVAGGCNSFEAASLASNPPPSLGTHQGGPFTDLSWRGIMARGTNTPSNPLTYHNLRVTKVNFPMPSLVLMRSNCGGVSSTKCYDKLEATQINFDVVDWTEKEPVKTSYTLIFSSQSPYFAAQLLSCGSTTVPYNSQRLAILQCEEVKDFTFGHN